MSRRLLVALLPLLVLVAACSSDDPAESQESQPAAAASPPPGFAVRSLEGIDFATPQEWTPITTQAQPGVTELALRAPGAEGQAAPLALAQLQREGGRPAAEEADSLVTVKRDVQQAADVASVPLVLPGFDDALLVSYDEQGPDGDLIHTDSMVADLSGGGLFVLTVKGTPEDFASEQLDAIARSVTAES